jgi:hypothetical protein
MKRLLSLAACILASCGASNVARAQAEPTALAQADPPPAGVTFRVTEPVAIDFRPWASIRFPDEHMSFIKYPDGYRIWSSSAAGRAFVWTSSDLETFTPAAANPVFGPPAGPDQSFDRNYAGPGEVIRDPANPKKYYMFYEADTRCYGDPPQCGPTQPYWASVGVAQAVDTESNGAPTDWSGFPGRRNAAGRTVAVASPDGPPSTVPPQGYYGNGIPSGFVDPTDAAHRYLYVYYDYHPYPADETNQHIEVARATFASVRAGAPVFQKFADGRFGAPFDRAGQRIVQVDASGGCVRQGNPAVSYNTVLRSYLMVYGCSPAGRGATEWYYTTTKSMETQAWNTPRLIVRFERGHPWYPSLISPDQKDNFTTDGSGKIFCQWGRYAPFVATFTITAPNAP